MKLVLASSSPRRKKILSFLNVPFEVCSTAVDETPRLHEEPRALALRLSREKARAAARSCGQPESLVLAADTVVVIDEQILGKPKDAAEAESILRRLRGREHEVFTGLSLIHAADGAEWAALCETRVRMRAYSDAEILDYVASGSAFDKAGAYAIQDAAFHPVEKIAGCCLNVMGLPLCEVIRGLERMGIAIGAREPAPHDTLWNGVLGE